MGSVQEIEARVWAIEEALIYLVALHYTQDELAGIIKSYQDAARRLLIAPEGTVMHPAAVWSPKVVFAAMVQDATANLFERAAAIALKGALARGVAEGHPPA
jgi:hypothetical protein